MILFPLTVIVLIWWFSLASFHPELIHKAVVVPGTLVTTMRGLKFFLHSIVKLEQGKELLVHFPQNDFNCSSLNGHSAVLNVKENSQNHYWKCQECFWYLSEKPGNLIYSKGLVGLAITALVAWHSVSWLVIGFILLNRRAHLQGHFESAKWKKYICQLYWSHFFI